MAFGQYRGRTIGRVMHFLYEYDMRSDECIFHGEAENPMITLDGKPYANYTWDEDTDVPTFTFFKEFGYLEKSQNYKKPYILEVEKKREEIFGEKDEMDE